MSNFSLKDSSLVKTQAFIDGKWLDAHDGKTIKVTNPSTGEELGTVPDMGRAETVNAIQAADKAFTTWSKTTSKHRHDILTKLSRLMNDNTDDLGRIITLEHGKTFSDAKGEVGYAASFIEWFAEESVRIYGETLPSPIPNTRNVVIKQPVGVVAAVTPSNFPAAMVARKLGPALAAGCTVVLKPSSSTPYSALALAELARRAGVPDGVMNIVTTRKHVHEVGKELCENKEVKKVTFTGSTAVAKLFYKQSAGTMKKITLSASGNAPFIVFDDANIDAAVIGCVRAGFRNTGQTCNRANRIFVQSSVYAEFAKRLATKVAAFKMGDGFEEGTTHGPLVDSRVVDKIEAHVNDAVQRGASVLVGGKRLDRPGSFFAPTVLSEVPQDALLSVEETFGPLAGLIRFDTEEEVLRLANKSEYGLAGYFYSRDVGRVWRVVEALQVGLVGANSPSTAGVHIPFGGIKDSGLGREGGHSIEEFLNMKHVSFGL